MSKTPLPYFVGDISQLAKNLRRQLDDREGTPSHVEMLNLLVKAGGYRNFQHFKVQHEANANLRGVKETTPEINYKRVKQLVRHFDGEGRLVRWPKKFSLRMICLWVMWSHIPARERMTEIEINMLLKRLHLFEDHALLRRELVDREFIERTDDGREYVRIEQQPTADAIESFRLIREKIELARKAA